MNQICLDPESPEEFFSLEDDKPVSVETVFSGEAFQQLVQFPIIVEMYERVVTKYGSSRKRKYHAEFNEQERRTIASYYAKFYRWHLVTGVPRKVMVKLRTIRLLRRAVHFFATA